ncbi:MAG TPA: DUF3822 family protein [Parasegetibacter sp.]
MLTSAALTPSFKVPAKFPVGLDYGDAHLLIDLSERTITTAVFLESSNKITALEQYNYLPGTESVEKHIQDFLLTNDSVRKPYKATWICCSLPDAILFPEELHEFGLSENALNTICGNLHNSEVMTETIHPHGIVNVYRIPSGVYDLIASRFSEESCSHCYSVLLKSLKQRNDQEEAVMDLVFYPGRMMVALTINGKINLIQNISYNSSEEAIYYLLNVREQFSLDVNTLKVNLSGLLDSSSGLYDEICKYFFRADFAARPSEINYDAAFDEFPSHFFIPIFNLGLCVSLEVN